MDAGDYGRVHSLGFQALDFRLVATAEDVEDLAHEDGDAPGEVAQPRDNLAEEVHQGGLGQSG